MVDQVMCAPSKLLGVDRDCRYRAGLLGCWGPLCRCLSKAQGNRVWPFRTALLYGSIRGPLRHRHGRHHRNQVLYSPSRPVGRDNTTVDLDLLQQHRQSAARLKTKNIHR